MGKELELKLAVTSPALLEQILFDSAVAEVRQGGYRLLDMATVYYDTADRALAAKNWTLRLRQENERLVATVKTPAIGRGRMEWECEAPSIQAALPLLLEAGAPEELSQLGDGFDLQPYCVAQFTRREAELSFADGTVCTLCGDVGQLAGGTKQEDLCEVELELKTGDFSTVEAFGQELMERFSLQEEPLSKFARAARLRRSES